MPEPATGADPAGRRLDADPLTPVKPASVPAGTMSPMGAAIQTIAIHKAAAQPGCGGCLRGSGPVVCRAVLGEACAAPQLQGSAQAVHRVMAVLGPALGFAAGSAGAGTGVVLSLSVQAGEVDLRLVANRQCGGAALADAAFQALRGLLHDTDIYVRHAA